MKVVINRCYGGFGLSDEAIRRLVELGEGEKLAHYDGIERHNHHLVQVVEELGARASDGLADLEVVEIPDGAHYELEEYDGMEWLSKGRWHD